MTSEALQKARDFEAQYGPHIPDSERPAFHATPTIGWAYALGAPQDEGFHPLGASALRPGPGRDV